MCRRRRSRRRPALAVLLGDDALQHRLSGGQAGLSKRQWLCALLSAKPADSRQRVQQRQTVVEPVRYQAACLVRGASDS